MTDALFAHLPRRASEASPRSYDPATDRGHPVGVLSELRSEADQAIPEAPPAHSPFVEPPLPEPAPVARSAPGRPGTEPRAPLWSFDPAGSVSQDVLAPTHPRTGVLRAVARPHLGPPGRRRSPLAVVLLSIVTLGAYGLRWHLRVNHEMREFDPSMSVAPGRSAWALVPPWVAGVGVTAVGAAELLSTHFRWGLHLGLTRRIAYAMLGAPLLAPYLALLLPLSCVAVVMTLERLRQSQEAAGLEADRQVRPHRAALLLLLPIIGAPLLVAMVQRRLNAAWERAVSPRRGTAG